MYGDSVALGLSAVDNSIRKTNDDSREICFCVLFIVVSRMLKFSIHMRILK